MDLKQLRYNQSMTESLFRGKYANDDALTNYDLKKIDFQQTNKHGFARKKILEILVIVQKSME